jgi:hypothetical protein
VTQPKKSDTQPLEDQVLSRMLAMKPDPKMAKKPVTKLKRKK